MTLEMDPDKPVFAARLTPHRSLKPAGIRAVVMVYAALCVIPVLYLVSTSAWPLVFILVLSTASLWLALSISFSTGRTFEEVTLWRHQLKIRHVTYKGYEHRHGFNPVWVRLEIIRDRDDRVTRLALSNRDKAVEIGAFLNPDDKASFARAFGSALHRMRS